MALAFLVCRYVFWVVVCSSLDNTAVLHHLHEDTLYGYRLDHATLSTGVHVFLTHFSCTLTARMHELHATRMA